MALLSLPGSSGTMRTHSHIHAEKRTHTPHITEGGGEGPRWGRGVTAHLTGEGRSGEEGFLSACKRPRLFWAFSSPSPWLKMGMEGEGWG